VSKCRWTGFGPILIAEDDEAVAELLRGLVEAAGYDAVVATSGDEALELARDDAPSVAILDVNLPGVSGYEVCHELRRMHGPALPILIVSGDRTESYDRVAGLLLGADDYLVKPFAPDELLVRVRSLMRRSAPAAVSRVSLTSREFEVLTLLSDGLDQTAIADRLVISPKTVGTHIERILGKLGARSRAQAVAIAYRDALVPVGS
jgi:DNA-binding NarL/FixJ family response regulator